MVFALQLHVISFGCFFCITNDKSGGPTRTTSLFFIQIYFSYTTNHLSSPVFIHKSIFIPPIINHQRSFTFPKVFRGTNFIEYFPGKFIDFLVKNVLSREKCSICDYNVSAELRRFLLQFLVYSFFFSFSVKLSRREIFVFFFI